MDLSISNPWKRIIMRAIVTGVVTFASTWAAAGSPQSEPTLIAAVLAGIIAFLTDIQGALGQSSTPPAAAKKTGLAAWIKAL